MQTQVEMELRKQKSRPETIQIRRAEEKDWTDIWAIFRSVVRSGDTYAIDPQISEADAKGLWMEDGVETFVAEVDGSRVGTFILKPNQTGPGDHVANAAFMVSGEARGRGFGEAIGRQAIELARSSGYRAMQFNFVVSTNTGAIRL